ncbi:hypothetical protein FACS1894122_09550 [Alphaproteobacteria bacterium]|nr:hypothetical protein FACS1894122_09550 [Alphaproteobacteria bacterium]
MRKLAIRSVATIMLLCSVDNSEALFADYINGAWYATRSVGSKHHKTSYTVETSFAGATIEAGIGLSVLGFLVGCFVGMAGGPIGISIGAAIGTAIGTGIGVGGSFLKRYFLTKSEKVKTRSFGSVPQSNSQTSFKELETSLKDIKKLAQKLQTAYKNVTKSSDIVFSTYGTSGKGEFKSFIAYLDNAVDVTRSMNRFKGSDAWVKKTLKTIDFTPAVAAYNCAVFLRNLLLDHGDSAFKTDPGACMEFLKALTALEERLGMLDLPQISSQQQKQPTIMYFLAFVDGLGLLKSYVADIHNVTVKKIEIANAEADAALAKRNGDPTAAQKEAYLKSLHDAYNKQAEELNQLNETEIH